MLTNKQAMEIDLSKINKIHMIGISGPFNSFCATILLNLGKKLTASELNQNNKMAKYWIKQKVLFDGGHDKKYINKDLDLVVVPNGPIPGNPEIEEAEKIGITTIKIGQLTGLLTRNLKTIAVAGTHGKTTTASLITWLLMQTQGAEPNFIIGDATDYIIGTDKNWNVNKQSEYLVLEACEYKKQFLQRAPKPFISVVTSIDLDHTDYYKNQSHYNEAFVEFLDNTTNSIVINTHGKQEKRVLNDLKTKASIIASQNFETKLDENKFKNLFGQHNVQNASKALAVAKLIKVDINKATNILYQFPGISKRFEFVGYTQNQNPIYKDYAHNPAKISACIDSAKKKYPDKKIVLVFQPHNAERTFTFKNKYTKAIKGADFVILTPIYYHVRETTKEKKLISNKEFFAILKNKNPEINITSVTNLNKLRKKLKEIERNQSNLVFVFAGAGDLHTSLQDITYQTQ